MLSLPDTALLEKEAGELLNHELEDSMTGTIPMFRRRQILGTYQLLGGNPLPMFQSLNPVYMTEEPLFKT